MNIIIYLGGLMAGFLVSLFWKPARQVVALLSKIYLWLVLLSVVSIWIFYFAGINNATALRAISQELNWAGDNRPDPDHAGRRLYALA